jgi:hypothetical protein
VHAWPQNASIALVVASEAERAYAALSTELRPPRGPVDIVLYDNVDFPNGFTNVFPTRRISLYLNPPAGEIGLARYDEWLRLVVTHELTHVFHLDRANGIWGSLQHLFGRSPFLFPNMYRPAWVGEGLATYYETKMTAGGRGRGAFHSQLLTAAQHHWPAPGDVNLTNSSWPGGVGPYAWGSHFFIWEASAHGDSVIPRFVDRTSRGLWPLAISAPLRGAGGDGLDTDWSHFEKSWQADDPPKPSTVLLARGLRVEPHPRLSADGTRLAFVQNDGKNIERVVVRGLKDGREIARQRINGYAELAWQGNDVIIAEPDYTSPVEVRSSLARWTPGASNRRLESGPRLTRPFELGGAIGAVKFGPDSTTVVRVSGDSVTPIPVPDGDAWSYLAVSPDSKHIAGARHLHQQWDIVVWPTRDPTKVISITDDAALDDDPAWSSDGHMVLFTSERSGLPQVYGYEISTGKTTQLTDEPTGARDGELAPDGSVVFSTILDDGYAVASRPPGPVKPVSSKLPEPHVVLQPSSVSPSEEAYSPWSSALPHYWLPLFYDAAEAGRFVGAATSGSDVVGRINYTAGLGHALENPRWEALLALSYTRWSSLILDLTAQQYWDVAGLRAFSPVGPSVVVSERYSTLAAGATVVRRRWRSAVSLRLAGELTQDAFFVPDSINFQYPNPKFAGGVTNFSARYTHQQALSISPEDGLQLDGLYRRRWVTSGTGWSDELRGTLRGYLGVGLPGFSRWVIAGRISGLMSNGPYAKAYALGGYSNSIYTALPGQGLASESQNLGLRGYPRGIAQFTRLVTTTAELRVPLFLVGKGVGRLPLSVDKISFSIFGETGGGWRPGVGSTDIAQYRDAGAELVLDVGILLDTPLRVRVGAAQALTTGLGAAQGDWRGYITVGSSF